MGLAYNFMLVHYHHSRDVLHAGRLDAEEVVESTVWIYREQEAALGLAWLLEPQSLPPGTLFTNKATSPIPCQVVPLPDDKHSNP